MSAALVVMATAPVAGQCKPRLCPPLDPAQAAALETLRVVDTFDDAIAVATLAPWTRFAATLELLGVTG